MERTNGNVPHAGKQLDQAPVAKGRTDDDVDCADISGSHVDQAQDEGGQGEGAESQRSGIGNLAVFDGAIGPGLELTTKGGQKTGFGGVDVSQRTIAKASGRFGRLVLFVGHLAGGRIVGGVVRGIDLFVGAIETVRVLRGHRARARVGFRSDGVQRLDVTTKLSLSVKEKHGVGMICRPRADYIWRAEIEVGNGIRTNGKEKGGRKWTRTSMVGGWSSHRALVADSHIISILRRWGLIEGRSPPCSMLPTPQHYPHPPSPFRKKTNAELRCFR